MTLNSKICKTHKVTTSKSQSKERVYTYTKTSLCICVYHTYYKNIITNKLKETINQLLTLYVQQDAPVLHNIIRKRTLIG